MAGATSASLLVGVCLFASTACAQPAKLKPKLEKTMSTYPTLHASPRRDGVLAASHSGSGAVAWSAPLPATTAEQPPAVLNWGAETVVVTPSAIHVFDESGKLRWQRAKWTGSPAAVANGLLYFENPAKYLDAVTSGNEAKLSGAALPGIINDEFRLVLLWPRETDFISAIYWQGHEEVAQEKASPVDAEISGRRTVYGARIGEWGGGYPGRLLLAPLFVPATQTLLLPHSKVVSVNVQTEEEGTLFAIPLETQVEWSARADGLLTVTGVTHEGEPALLWLNAEGAQTGRWVNPEKTERWSPWQPPIQMADGRTYAVTSGRLLAFEGGKLLWNFDARSSALRHGADANDGTFSVTPEGKLVSTLRLRHASALADGSVLLTGGRKVWKVNAAGQPTMEVTLPEEPLSPPVVNGAGHILVATATQLLQLD
jgi:outer membrane protein assembly factor BamB